MRRIFDASPETDLLLEKEAKVTGRKLNWIMDNAIYSNFIPRVNTLALEAKFIVSAQIDNTLSEEELRTSISRGISWLANFPIKDNHILREVFSNYLTSAFEKDTSANEYVLSLFKDVAERIKETEPTFTESWYCYPAYAEQILDHWDSVWNYEKTYKALSAIVYLCKPRNKYDWFDAIIFLNNVEIMANKEHGLR